MTINKTKSERGFIYRVVLISVVLLAVFSVVALRVASDMDNVRSIYAVRIAGAGRFSRAMETARRIEDREILNDCKYEIASLMFDAGEYQSAMREFDKLGDYKDAAGKKLESRYHYAHQLYNAGDVDKAKEEFLALGSYSDSAQMLTQCSYDEACILLNDGEYLQALVMFAGLGDFSDSSDMAYSAALNLTGDEETARILVNNGGLSPESVKKAADITAQRAEIPFGKLDAGNYHTVYLRADASVRACGDNSFGQCDTEDWSGVVQVAAGAEHTVGLRGDGTVVAVGNNEYGQCNVQSWTDVVSIAAGDYDTVALRADGSFVSCGYHSFEALKKARGINMVFAGPYGAAAVTDSGQLIASHKSIKAENPQILLELEIGIGYCAALYSDGEFRLDSYPDVIWKDVLTAEASPRALLAVGCNGKVLSHFFREEDAVDFSSLDGIRLCAAGTEHYVFLADDGQLYAFGDNSFGQCDVSKLAEKAPEKPD